MAGANFSMISVQKTGEGWGWGRKAGGSHEFTSSLIFAPDFPGLVTVCDILGCRCVANNDVMWPSC
jgi:hypothetical protein